MKFSAREISRNIYDGDYEHALIMLLQELEQQQKQIEHLTKQVDILKKTKIENL